MPNPRMPKKGTKGAAKNYISRQQAIKKLQCSLADFRRLCILKGIYPREPRNKKKANKGSTAPATFYYVKDIQYLLHEPVLHKLREHKTFAKKLAKALGRREFGLAKNLDENKPRYRLDHIIKERYPTFQDSLRDLDDALSLIVLFAHLPANQTVPAEIVANCAKLYAEWQLYVMRTRALKKVFLSIKGIYYQAQIQGVPITWLVPYQFTQHVPTDIDFRIMLTFLDLYQTLLGFTFYKLYTDANLIYPPAIDFTKDDAAAGIGAHLLQEATTGLLQDSGVQPVGGPKISTKQVKQQIKSIAATTEAVDESETVDDQALVLAQDAIEEDAASKLFDDYFFYLSREVTRPFLEFVIRSFGGKVGWDSTLGAGSPFGVNDPRITHHIVDRPLPTDPEALAALMRERNGYPGRRTYVQPQWVVDCLNTESIKPTGLYAPGETLPPHLSPFVDDRQVARQGGYVPREARAGVPELQGAEQSGSSDSSEEEVEEEEDEPAFQSAEDYNSDDFAEPASAKPIAPAYPPALLASALKPTSESLRHAAELDAESRNISHEAFEAERQAAIKQLGSQRGQKRSAVKEAQKDPEGELADIMVTGKKRKMLAIHERRKAQQQSQVQQLERKKKALAKGGPRKA